MHGDRPLTYPFHRSDPLVSPPEYARLRAERPVARVVLATGSAVWLVTRFADVRTVLADPRFSRAALTSPDAPRISPLPMPANALFTTDPPEHTRLRSLVGAAFTPRRTELTRAHVRAVAADLLDQLAAGPRPADLAEALAFPLPVALVCELLGVPVDDRDELRGWSDQIFGIGSFPEDEVFTAFQSIWAYLDKLLEAKRQRPAADLLSTVVAANDEQGYLDQPDLIILAMTLLMVGYPTTVNALSCGLLMLLRHPDRYAALHAEPGLLEPAVDELLRLNPPSANLSQLRVATDDVELAGTVIRAGDGVIPSIASANRDPARFPDPERFDIRRPAVEHIAMGHGPHYCLGAALARVEVEETVRALVDRFPGMRLAAPDDPVPWREQMFGVEVRNLAVTW